MQQRSPKFDDAINNGMLVTAVADVYRSGQPIRTNIPLGGGTVKIDVSSAQHRSMDVLVIDEDGTLTPRIQSDPLTPYNGNELKIRSGFLYPDGTSELLSLGVFRIEEYSIEDRGIIKVSGPDRSIVVQEARFEIPHAILSGTTDSAAIKKLIESRISGLDWSNWPTAGAYNLQATVYEEGDRSGNPWQICHDLASNGGREVLFDPEGRPILRVVKDAVSSSPSWTYAPGNDNILLKSTKKASSQGVRNVWVVMGESAAGGAAPVRAASEITDQTSPIFPSAAGFGRRPAFYASTYITTQAQAQATADKMKVEGAGTSEVVGFTAIPHPAQEGRDVVKVVDSDTGIDADIVLSSFDMDIFLAEATTFSTTGRRVA